MAENLLKLYFIAVVPHEQLVEEVTQIKNYIAEHFESKHSLKSPPHITMLMPFKWKEEKESLLIDFLQNFSSGRPAFEVKLKDFNSFPRRVVYIDVEKNQQLKNLYLDLNAAIRKELKLIKDSTYKNQGFAAHMTIAHRDLKPAAFDRVWAEFKTKSFDNYFQVDHICLLKHHRRNWDIHKRFKF
jgi:2'-5' RNA ligase